MSHDVGHVMSHGANQVTWSGDESRGEAEKGSESLQVTTLSQVSRVVTANLISICGAFDARTHTSCALCELSRSIEGRTVLLFVPNTLFCSSGGVTTSGASQNSA